MDQLLFIYLVGGLAVIISCLASIFWFGGMILPMFYGGGPFVPSSNKTVERMIRLAQIKETDRVCDLGSGDGRMLLAAMRAGAKSAVGYEIHPGLVLISHLRMRAKKIQNQVHTVHKSLWKADLHDVTVVLLYQLPETMVALEKKLRDELPIGARIVSHAFPLKHWKPELVEGNLYVYKK